MGLVHVSNTRISILGKIMSEDTSKTQEEELKRCFVIMPISDVDGYAPGHFDRVFKHIIEPACKHSGYEAIRADVTAKTNVIIVDILRNALNCEMAICDLSARNPNVFYELGFRQAFNKKTVLMIDNKTIRPFDISAIRSFEYDSSLRIDLVDKAIQDLSKALKETQSMKEDETNSLLKLLSIESPAKLPEQVELSKDSSLILRAIQSINENLQRMNHTKNMFQHKTMSKINSTIINGKIVNIGEHLYDKLKDEEIGVITDITEDAIFVSDRYGSVDITPIDNINPQRYEILPF